MYCGATVTLLRRTLSRACLVPGVVLVYAGLAPCGLSMLLEPRSEE